MTGRQKFSLRTYMRELLTAAGDAGATLADLETAAGVDRTQVQRCLSALTELGEKFSAPISGKNWRHFATEAQRDAWVASNGGTATAAARPAPQPKAEKPVLRGRPMGAGHAQFPRHVPPAELAKAKRRAAEESSLANAPVTRCPAPPGRFEPAADYRGDFSLVGIGRDVRTGAAWGRV